MSLKYNISLLVLAGALVAAPPALAQPDPPARSEAEDEPVLESEIGIGAEDTLIDIDTDETGKDIASGDLVILPDDESSVSADGNPTAEIALDAAAEASTMDCPAEIRPFLQSTATAAELRTATEAEIVVLSGCASGGLFRTADFSPLRMVIANLPVTESAVEAASISVEDVVSARVSGDTATIYAVE